MTKYELVMQVINDKWSEIGPLQREPYESTYDGFTHLEKPGLADMIITEMIDEAVSFTTENIEQYFFDLV
jgi:hypothetical protein